MLIIVFGTLTTFSLMWKKKNQGYKNLEKELVTKVEGYFEQEHKYPTGIEVVTIDLKELQEHHYIERANLIKEKGFFIRPSELFYNVIKSVKSDSATFTDAEGKTKSVKDNLNEYLEKIINESISRK